MDIATLIQGTDARLIDESMAGTRVCDLTDDSRSVMPGSLFVARPGTASDGRAYIYDAIRAGADAILTTPDTPVPDAADRPRAWAVSDSIERDTAIIAERFFRNPSSELLLVGVTGTNGKTTIAHLVQQLLADHAGMPTGLIGTVQIDDGAEIAPAALTTPGAIELSYTLRTMRDNALEACAIEVSSHALAQERVGGLDFDVAVYTNLSGDHLDYHKTTEEYARAKSKLFAMLRADATAIINTDDAHAGVMLDACAAKNVVTCSLNGGADCTARVRKEGRQGTEVSFTGPFGSIDANLPLVGGYNVMNALQALAAAHACGVTIANPRAALESLSPPPGRLERVSPLSGPPAPFSVFVDFAHTDDALRATLNALRPLAERAHGQLHVVFGCGGDRDRTKRPRMARVCCELAHRVTITSDNPRREQPAAIIRDVLAGVPDDSAAMVDVDADRAVAIRRAIERAGEEDIVLIAGKGHETYQLLPDGAGGVRRIHFDDREVAREALDARFPAPAQADPLA